MAAVVPPAAGAMSAYLAVRYGDRQLGPAASLAAVLTTLAGGLVLVALLLVGLVAVL